jgi:hypothetical protein
VVLHEGAEERRVAAVGLHLVDAVDEAADAAAGGLEGLSDGEIAGTSKDLVDVCIVWTVLTSGS